MGGHFSIEVTTTCPDVACLAMVVVVALPQLGGNNTDLSLYDMIIN